MVKNTITCKKCGSEIEISEALTHQIEEQILASLDAKHKEELEVVRKQATEEVSKKVHEQFETQLKSSQKSNEEEQERNKKLTGQIDRLLEEMRKLRRKDEERETEMKKKILEEEEKIRAEAVKKTEEEHRLKDLEKDKKLQDTLKQVEELKTKMEQGSQQTQGEVLELEVERILKAEFPGDIIREVKKGERGADTIQEIIDKLGRKCGIILWESKNGQWQNGWITKLKEDQREKKADIAVLVVSHKPEWMEHMSMYKEGIWLTTWQSLVSVTFSLRYNLISLKHARATSVGKNEKMEVLYNYLTGIEFRHRVEAIVEAFTSLQGELEREKRWFSAKWNRQERQIRKVLDSTYGMHGDLQGIIGRSLPEIKTFELSESTED